MRGQRHPASSDMNMAGMEMASENAEQTARGGHRFSRPAQRRAAVRAPAMQPGFVLRHSVFRVTALTSRPLGAALQRSAQAPAALIHLHHLKFEISPPKVFTTDPPITTLRI